MMITVYINSVGLATPGIENWKTGQQVLCNVIPFKPEPLPCYKPPRLPANERRRATELIRLAFRACEDAIHSTQQNLNTMASVFATSGGDYQIFDQICRTLKNTDHAVSPTQFHNSVHNAAAGYWSIATKSCAPSICVAGYDATFTIGLIEAASFTATEKLTTLFIAYDITPPFPLSEKRGIKNPFAVAFLLTPQANAETFAKLDLSLVSHAETSPSPMTFSREINELIKSNPAARAIPLLKALTQRSRCTLALATNGSQYLRVIVTPC